MYDHCMGYVPALKIVSTRQERNKTMTHYAKLFTVVFVCGAFAVFGLVFHQEALSEEKVCDRTPTIISLQNDASISPSSTTVKLGNTIIWHNRSSGPVTIKFTTRIGLACAAPVNFYADLLGNYETTKIPPNGTASICLIEEGKYEYEVHGLVEKKNEPPYEVISTGWVLSVK
jgi:hypothetical protein